MQKKFGISAWPAYETKKINPYNYLIYSEIEKQGYTISEFSTLKKNIFNFKYLKKHKIIHIHWPANYLLFGQNKFLVWLRIYKFYAYVRFVKLLQIKLVWTVHNLNSHESEFPEQEKVLHRILYKFMDGFISMNRSGLDQIKENIHNGNVQKTIYIPHPNYKGYYANAIEKNEAREKLHISAESSVFLFLGQIRKYKNLPSLIEAFQQLNFPGKVLLIAGELHQEVKKEVLSSIGANREIVFYNGFIKDEDLQIFLNAADIVVTPYKKIFNSGSILLNLSFDRPTLAPDLYAIADMKEHVGKKWMKTYDTDISSEVLLKAIKEVKAEEEERGLPNLRFTSPEIIAKQTIQFYKLLLDN